MARLNQHADPDATLGLVFGSPDLLDVTEGQPLSSSAGRYLKHAIYESGIKPSDCFIDYICPSFPGRRGLASVEAQDEIASYRKELRSHIRGSKNLKAILLFGPETLEPFKITGSLSKVRGFVFDRTTPVIIPTFNPSFLFRGNGEQEVTFLNDIAKAVNISQHGFKRPAEDFILGPSMKQIWEYFGPLVGSDTRLYVDIEAVGSLNERDRNNITMIGVGNQKTKEIIVVPFITQGGIPYFTQNEENQVRRLISKVFQTNPCVFHNAEYDAKHLNYQGFGPVKIGGDTMLLHHCLSGETKINTLDFGDVPIESLVGKKDFWVVSHNGNKLTPAKVKNCWKTGNRKDTVRITFWSKDRNVKEGLWIDCTQDHLIRLIDGSWVKAGNLKPGDRITRGKISKTGVANKRVHRWVWEEVNKEKLNNYHIHHIDGNHLNNNPNNLKKVTISEHNSYHKEVQYRATMVMMNKAKEACEKSLNKEEVYKLYFNVGLSTREVAKYLGVKPHKIDTVFRWNNWKKRTKEEANRLAKEKRINCRVVSITELNKEMPVYDIEVEKYHNFSANGIIVHNSLHPELKHSLDYVTSVYGNIPYWKSTLKSAKHQLDIPNQELWTYNARDVLATMQIEPEIEKECREQNTYEVYENISIPMLDVVLEMNNNGLPIDASKLVAWKSTLSQRNTFILDSMSELWKIHPAFNWDSGQHLAWLFYEEAPTSLSKKKAEYAEYSEQGTKKKKTTKKYKALKEYLEIFRDTRPFRRLPGLSVKKTGAGAVSTDVEMRVKIKEAIVRRVDALLNMKRKTQEHMVEEIQLAAMRQVIDNLMEYSNNAKLLSTYTTIHIEPDSCVHPGFRVAGTKTGRLSSYSPNGQNQPPEAKKVFVAPTGTKFVQFDYTNLELVVLAYFGDIPYLIDVFKQGKNVHDENTKRFLSIDKEHPYWDEWRRAMKMYVFGRNYGGGLRGMYRRILVAIPGIQMTFKQFEELDKNYFDLMPEYKRWYDATIREVRNTRTLHNAFGRIRIFLDSLDKVEREALNFPVQSTAADIMAYSLINLHKALKAIKKSRPNIASKLVLTVHDSVVLIVPERELLFITKLLKRTMCAPLRIGKYDVSFTGDVKIMDNLKGNKEDEKTIDGWLEVLEKRKADKIQK